MKKDKIIEITSGVLILLLGVVVGFKIGASDWWQSQQLAKSNPSPDTNTADLKVFWEVWQKLEKKHLEPETLDPTLMVQGATRGLAASLGDPYTVYLEPETNQTSGETISGAFYGIGIEMGYIENTLAVISPIKGSPAEAAGFQAGDLLIHVKDEAADIDEDLFDKTTYDAMRLIRGQNKSPVTITLWRQDYNNNQYFDITLNRDEIKIPSLELAFITNNQGKKIAHLELSTFSVNTYQEWETAVQQILNEPSVQGIILDLRNNTGGLFDESIHIANEFIAADQVIVREEGRDEFSEHNQVFTANGRGRLQNRPLAVLINGGSASASEIVAGALRDQTDAKLIGTQTFGKGLVQERFSLSDGGGLHVTIARWSLPGGDWIQDNGIAPSIEALADPNTEADEVLNKALEQF